jgi:hypothetical protein
MAMQTVRTAAALALAGVALQAVAFVFVGAMLAAGWWWPAWGHMGFAIPWTGFWPYWGLLWLVAGAAVLAVGALGVVWMYDVRPERVHVGAVLVLLAAVLAFPTMWGFMVGSLLMFVAAILGLTWTPYPTYATVGPPPR